MIDSHCHLADAAFDADREAVVTRAHEAGIETMITIADSISEAEKCVQIAEKYDHIFCSVGVHPHNAKDWQKGDAAKLTAMTKRSKKVRAIGEIGLDYHYNHSAQDVQRGVFLEQLTLSRELGLPAVVHCRESIDDIRTIVQEVEPLQMVLHCCTEKWEDIEWLLELGHLLSFTGIATYPNAEVIRNVIKHCPLSKMMIETDAPYLAPIPHRGKRNEPAFIVEVARLIAKIKNTSLEEVEAQTTKNAVVFFGLSNGALDRN